jgi:hypothetical protein
MISSVVYFNQSDYAARLTVSISHILGEAAV